MTKRPAVKTKNSPPANIGKTVILTNKHDAEPVGSLLPVVHPSPVVHLSPVVRLSNVHLTLGNGASKVHVLKGIDLSIEQGISAGIVGPSGSGKSTLLMVLGGLERADSGFVEVAGEELSSKSEDQLAQFRGRNIGIVFQSFHLIPNMTALENVAIPLELAGDTSAFDKARSELVAVGLGERLNHYPGQMSGGEQQRVAIARALAPSPKLLIADEPTGNLDTSTGEQIADLLFAKQKERGTTLLLVTHDPKLAERCNRQISVSSGNIIPDLVKKAESS